CAVLNCSMTELFRLRVKPETLAKAEQVTNSLGTTPAEMVRVFLAEIANTGRIPVSLNRPAELEAWKYQEVKEAWRDYQEELSADPLEDHSMEKKQFRALLAVKLAGQLEQIFRESKEPAGLPASAQSVPAHK